MQVQVGLIAVRPMTPSGKLVALADVAVAWGDMEMTIRPVRIESLGLAGTKVCMPVDREGRAVLVLPVEIGDAVAEVVLAGGLETGVLKSRSVDPDNAAQGSETTP